MMPSNTRMPTIHFNQNRVSQNRQLLNLVEVGGGKRLQENSQKKCRRTSTLLNAGPSGTLLKLRGVGAGGCGKTLQKFFEFFQGQPAVGRVGFSQDNVASGLMILNISQLSKSLTDIFPGQNRKLTQREISTISSSIGGGIGSPCFFKLFRYPLMAS